MLHCSQQPTFSGQSCQFGCPFYELPKTVHFLHNCALSDHANCLDTYPHEKTRPALTSSCHSGLKKMTICTRLCCQINLPNLYCHHVSARLINISPTSSVLFVFSKTPHNMALPHQTILSLLYFAHLFPLPTVAGHHMTYH